MSEVDSRDIVNGDLSDQNNICRDFLRNVCRRGKRCKYRHPDPNEAKEMGRKIDYIFCHDYQNKECRRPNCKFIHCTRSEEDYYHATGELPQRITEVLAMRSVTGDPAMEADIPICKDYLKGECRRGGCCKFRHLSPNEYDRDMGGGRRSNPYNVYSTGYEGYDYYEPERKRRMYGDYQPPNATPAARQPMMPSTTMPPDYFLEENNAFLRRKVEELKKQVADLTATNEFLLDQNAQLRLGKQNAVSTVAQSLNAPSNAVLPSIAQMSMGGDMSAVQSTMQAPRMAQEMASQAPQSIPVVPVSLAPVSIASVSLTQAIPTVSLAPNPLVSYPIMTQNMRPAIPQNSLAH